LDVSKNIKYDNSEENAKKKDENTITDKNLETSGGVKVNENEVASVPGNSAVTDKEDEISAKYSNLNNIKLNESKINNNNNKNLKNIDNSFNNSNSNIDKNNFETKINKESEKDSKISNSQENNPFIDKQEKKVLLMDVSKNQNPNQGVNFDKVENNNNNIICKDETNKQAKNAAKGNNTSKNVSIILNNYNDHENNNIDIENEEAEIQININDNDISNINKDKIIEKHEISESSGAVVKLFTGEKNEIIEILNERLTEKEKQNKVLIQEIEKLKSN